MTFVISGMASLVHELSWSRQLGLVLGQTTDAATVVLVAYFAGLGLGAVLGATILRRRPISSLYGVAEIACGLWALIFPYLLRTLTGSIPGLVLLMIPATVAMGCTLPAFVAEFDRRSAFAYALNTLGGLLGIAASVMGLFVALGVSASSQAMGLVQIACGVIALAVRRPRESIELKSRPIRGSVFLLAFLSGFTTLSLELLHLRFHSFMFHNSTYSFALVLGTVILGLALGSFLVSFLGARVGHRRLLTWGVTSVSLLSSLGLAALVQCTDLRRFDAGSDFAGYMVGAGMLVTSFTLPPFLLAGLVLPATWNLSSRGRDVGYLTGVSSLGGALGAWVVNFHLLPAIGVVGSLSVVVVLAGISMLLAGTGVRFTAGVVSLALLPCLWMSDRLTTRLPDGSLELESRWESAYGWIDLTRCRERESFMEIRQNVHYVLGNTAARRSEERQGHVPLLLHPRPRSVLFIGLGTGLTAIAAVRHPVIEEATVVELIPDVIRAARQIGGPVAPLFADPRIHLLPGDGRRHLRTSGSRYDVITSDLFVPWESRTGYLYTREFYHETRSCLAPGGLFCQWLPLYQLGEKELEIILDTFASSFPVTTLWWCQIDARYPVLGMVGSEVRLMIDGEAIESRMPLEDPLLASSSRLLELHAGSWPVREGITLNTDERPVLEFSAPITERDGSLMTGDRLRAWFERTMTRLSPAGLLARSAPGQSLSTHDERREKVRRRLDEEREVCVTAPGAPGAGTR